MANYFSLFLTLSAVVTGIIWLLERCCWSAHATRKSSSTTTCQLNRDPVAGDLKVSAPGWISFFSAMFPMIALVLVVRSFLYEPYQIPSGSMMPTLLVGDFIVVKKFAYGIKDPVFQRQLLATRTPRRGEVAVFKYPEDPKIYFIKRIIGLPGDRVIYRGKRLFIQPAGAINTAEQPLLAIDYQLASSDQPVQMQQQNGALFAPLTTLIEQIGPTTHRLLVNSQPDNCALYYQQPGEPLAEWVVPPHHYFAMGDNRDNSRDSRFWGFVPEQNLVGQAVGIWMSFEKQPNEWPTAVRWQRLGAIQ